MSPARTSQMTPRRTIPNQISNLKSLISDLNKTSAIKNHHSAIVNQKAPAPDEPKQGLSLYFKPE